MDILAVLLNLAKNRAKNEQILSKTSFLTRLFLSHEALALQKCHSPYKHSFPYVIFSG